MVYRLFYLIYKKVKHELGVDLIPNFLRRAFASLFMKISTLGAKKYPYPDKTVLDYDWDYLIVIDACRHDLFEEVYGKTDYMISQGSCTTEWFDRTFENKNYEDIIFVSGNVMISEYKQERLKENKISFFKLEPVWDYGWDEDLKATLPSEITDAALELSKKHPKKKMIVHYLQPHRPFIGKEKLIGKGMNTEEKKDTVWALLRKGKIEQEDFKKAYKSNLKLVMEEVNKLVKNLKGRIILTSDHGNCLGEHGLYAHPKKMRIEELVKVPWVVLKGGKGAHKSSRSNEK